MVVGSNVPDPLIHHREETAKTAVGQIDQGDAGADLGQDTFGLKARDPQSAQTRCPEITARC